jgi:hypothetical protein
LENQQTWREENSDLKESLEIVIRFGKYGKKNRLNSEKIWKIWKKSLLNSEMIWKIWKKGKLNSDKI